MGLNKVLFLRVLIHDHVAALMGLVEILVVRLYWRLVSITIYFLYIVESRSSLASSGLHHAGFDFSGVTF